MVRERGRALTAACAALVLALAAAGCGSAGDRGAADDGVTAVTEAAGAEGIDSGKSVESQTTATSDEGVAAAVEAAYRAAIDALNDAAIEPVDPDDPELARWTTGPALTRARGLLTGLVDRGHALRLPEPSLSTIRVESVEVTERTAIAEVCVRDDGVVYDLSTGAVIDDEVVSQGEVVNLSLGDEGWQVYERSIDQSVGARCDVA